MMSPDCCTQYGGGPWCTCRQPLVSKDWVGNTCRAPDLRICRVFLPFSAMEIRSLLTERYRIFSVIAMAVTLIAIICQNSHFPRPPGSTESVNWRGCGERQSKKDWGSRPRHWSSGSLSYDIRPANPSRELGWGVLLANTLTNDNLLVSISWLLPPRCQWQPLNAFRRTRTRSLRRGAI